MYAELEQKKCSICTLTKKSSDFYKVSRSQRLRPECKSCTNDYHKQYRSTESGAAATKRARIKYHESPDNVTRDKQNKAEWARFKKYGMVKSEFTSML